MKNPSFGELRSLFQTNQACKEENQRMNLTFKNFATLCEIFASQKEFCKPCETDEFGKPCETDEFRNSLRNILVIFI